MATGPAWGYAGIVGKGTFIEMGVTTGLTGKGKLFRVRAHRLAQYCKAYNGVVEGTHSLDYLNERLNKLIQVGITAEKVNHKEGHG